MLHRSKVQQADSLAVKLVSKCRLAWWACQSLRPMSDADPTYDGLRTLRLHRGHTGRVRRSSRATSTIKSSVSGKGYITVESADWQCVVIAQSTLSRYLNWHIISVSASASTASRICTRNRKCQRYSKTLTVLTCSSLYFTPSMVVIQKSSPTFSNPLTCKAPTSSNRRISHRTKDCLA